MSKYLKSVNYRARGIVPLMYNIALLYVSSTLMGNWHTDFVVSNIALRYRNLVDYKRSINETNEWI